MALVLWFTRMVQLKPGMARAEAHLMMVKAMFILGMLMALVVGVLQMAVVAIKMLMAQVDIIMPMVVTVLTLMMVHTLILSLMARHISKMQMAQALLHTQMALLNHGMRVATRQVKNLKAAILMVMILLAATRLVVSQEQLRMKMAL